MRLAGLIKVWEIAGVGQPTIKEQAFSVCSALALRGWKGCDQPAYSGTETGFKFNGQVASVHLGRQWIGGSIEQPLPRYR